MPVSAQAETGIALENQDAELAFTPPRWEVLESGADASSAFAHLFPLHKWNLMPFMDEFLRGYSEAISGPVEVLCSNGVEKSLNINNLASALAQITFQERLIRREHPLLE